VPIWVAVLVVFLVLPGLVLWGATEHARADRREERLDALQQRYDEHMRQDKIARWRDRCERIASESKVEERRSMVEICMANAAKEEYR
jgi:hypothetical protein